MASSLQSSCMVLSSSSSSSTPNPRNNISQLRKPSTLLTNPSRSRRFHVSCSSGSDSDGSIDRRNMLLGLGGLYGAANLISDPKAAYGAGPIQPPDLTKCGAATPRPGEDPLDFSCCPPVTDDIKDYKLPLVKKMLVRPAAHTLSPQYIAKYEEAIRRMRALDKTDPNDPRGFTQQANIHCAYCNGAYDQVGFGTTDLSIHFSWIFFPFHRWYLYFYERILGSLISDPTFALPYWNWDNPPGMRLPGIFNNEKSPLYDVNRNPEHRTPQILDLSLNFKLDEDEKKVINSNLNIISTEMLRVDSFEDFMGKAYRAGDIATPGGGTVENGSHTAIHRWTGNPANQYNEDLGNFYSAGRDTAFYSHHANVDRMWTIWQDLKTKVPKTSNDPDYLNTEFLFYDEKKQLVRVKVADSLDNEKMGFVYQKEKTPWLFYVPPKKASGVSIKDITKGATTADKLFPLSLDGIIRVLVPKTAKGKAEEVLVLEDIETDPRQFIKFDVYINDDDDSPGDVDRAEYVGSFSQLPHKVHFKQGKGTLRFSLKDVYEDIQTDENDDSVVVTIVPRTNGKYVTIGGIRIIKSELQNTV